MGFVWLEVERGGLTKHTNFISSLLSHLSGPFRYDLIGGRWIYARDGHDMVDKLRSELTELVGTAPPL